MNRPLRPLRHIGRDTRGANKVEYLILVGLVALLALGAYRAFGTSVSKKAEDQAAKVAQLEGAGTGPTKVSGSSTPKKQSPPKKPSKSFGTRLWDFGKGFVGGAVDTVTGLWHVVTHPVETAKGVAFAVTHPVTTAKAIKESVVAAWNENPDEFAGRAVFEIVSALGPGAVTKASKLKSVAAVDDVADAAKLAKQADHAADAAKVAKGADDAAAAAAAAAAKKADDPGKFAPVGIGKAALSTPEGQSLLRELKKADPTASPATIRARAHTYLDSGKALPIERLAKPGEKLYKLVPVENGAPSAHSGFWMPKSQLDELIRNPKSIPDKMGLPKESVSPSGKYTIYEIQPQPGKTPKIFESEVGPTYQGGTHWNGGGKQTIVPDRSQWTAPIELGTIP